VTVPRTASFALAALISFGAAGLCAQDPATTARRAAAWLREQQQPDGSWRSAQYGVLRGGQALTPFVLHALLSLPQSAGGVRPASVDRALAFIRSRVTPEGALGYHDPDVLEYPVYATAHALRVLVRAAPRDALAGKMAAWLATTQLAEGRGFDPASPAYGGFGFGVLTLPPGTPGHVDLAHTRRVLEALRDAKALPEGVRVRSLRFLGLLQKQAPEIARFPGVPGFPPDGEVPFDGGFFFSPVVLVANKALWEPPAEGRAAHFRSYSTATADGALALLAAGVGADDARVRAASAWLARRASVDVTGIPADHPEPWAIALRFYQFAVLAEATASLGLEGFAEPLGRRLAALQRPDGSFVNHESPLMKEDDPILATALALIALGRVLPQDDPATRPDGAGSVGDARPHGPPASAGERRVGED
jgi:hypothetical protein